MSGQADNPVRTFFSSAVHAFAMISNTQQAYKAFGNSKCFVGLLILVFGQALFSV
jgi:hypothetical protein